MALCALGTVAVVWLMAARLWGAASGWRAAAVLSGMLLFLVLGQLLTLDMSLTFYMIGELGRISAGAANASCRVATLDAAGLGRRGARRAHQGPGSGGHPGRGAARVQRCFARCRAVAAAAVARGACRCFWSSRCPGIGWRPRRLSDFLEFFFVHEHFARYLTPSADREEPWWFFGWVFLAGSVPWTLSALRVVVFGWRARAPSARRLQPAACFCGSGWSSSCVFFSLSDSKLMPYILPAMPALAVLIAALPAETLKRDFLVTAVVTTLAGLSLLIASFNWATVIAASDRSASFLPLASPLREVAAVLLVSGIFVWVQGARDATRAALFLGTGWCLAGLLVIRAAALLAPIYSGIDLAAALPASERDAPVYSVGTYDQSLTFYLRRPVTLVRYRGELDYGLKKTPDAGGGGLG